MPGSLRGSAVLYGASWWWRACGELLHSVRTGQPAFDHVHGRALFRYLDSEPDAAAIFNEHQSNMTRQDAAAVVAAYNFAEYATVIDVVVMESVPSGANAYVRNDILHDWGDQEATAILRNCRRAMEQTPAVAAKLLVIEKVIPRGNEAFRGKLTDITMPLLRADASAPPKSIRRSWRTPASR